MKKLILTFLAVCMLLSIGPVKEVHAAAFPDVAAEAWYAPYIDEISDRGIMTGMGDGVFAPERIISRAQFATILYRLEGSPEVPFRKIFPDVTDGNFYSLPVVWANSKGIITGYKSGFFGPADPITREQLALMLYRYEVYKHKSAPAEGNANQIFSAFVDRAGISPFAKQGMGYCVSQKILSGKESPQGKLLSPTGQATRAEAATMILRYMDVAGKNKNPKMEAFFWNPDFPYANFSLIHDDGVTLYHSQAANRNGIRVAVNAGHGTKGGNKVFTYCHPDKTPKVTGGSTAAGSITAAAVSSGMSFRNGVSEGVGNLSMAMIAKDKLLAAGFDVLMIRENDNTRLDNVARSVMANQFANCHLAIHYNSTDYDAGFFYIAVPSNKTYRAMEPVKSHWQEHNALGDAILSGMRTRGVKIRANVNGVMELDLTQTSYSTVPSVDIEVGDKASDISPTAQNPIGDGIVLGIKNYFHK